MKIKVVILTLLVAFLCVSADLNAGDDFSVDLQAINASVSSDEDSFAADLSAEFGISVPKLKAMKAKFGLSNGDLYFALELGKTAKKPAETVAQEYKKNPGKGWGAIARQMGIKPGSPEFKALKAKTKMKSEKAEAGKNKKENKGKKKK